MEDLNRLLGMEGCRLTDAFAPSSVRIRTTATSPFRKLSMLSILTGQLLSARDFRASGDS
jgi:hypothetical protein